MGGGVVGHPNTIPFSCPGPHWGLRVELDLIDDPELDKSWDIEDIVIQKIYNSFNGVISNKIAITSLWQVVLLQSQAQKN